MCKCRQLRERVVWLEKVISDASWKLRHRDGTMGDGRDSPHRRTQLIVAHDLSNGLAGLEPYNYAAPPTTAEDEWYISQFDDDADPAGTLTFDMSKLPPDEQERLSNLYTLAFPAAPPTTADDQGAMSDE